MSYQTALPIIEVMEQIHRKKYLLPAIQREFVWDTEQIERLFDSLLRSYPISSFLFWKVNKDKVHDFEFYEFIKNYHEKNNRHNPKATMMGGRRGYSHIRWSTKANIIIYWSNGLLCI